jgi:hypothetical protein
MYGGGVPPSLLLVCDCGFVRRVSIPPVIE